MEAAAATPGIFYSLYKDSIYPERTRFHVVPANISEVATETLNQEMKEEEARGINALEERITTWDQAIHKYSTLDYCMTGLAVGLVVALTAVFLPIILTGAIGLMSGAETGVFLTGLFIGLPGLGALAGLMIRNERTTRSEKWKKLKELGGAPEDFLPSDIPTLLKGIERFKKIDLLEQDHQHYAKESLFDLSIDKDSYGYIDRDFYHRIPEFIFLTMIKNLGKIEKIPLHHLPPDTFKEYSHSPIPLPRRRADSNVDSDDEGSVGGDHSPLGRSRHHSFDAVADETDPHSTTRAPVRRLSLDSSDGEYDPTRFTLLRVGGLHLGSPHHTHDHTHHHTHDHTHDLPGTPRADSPVEEAPEDMADDREFSSSRLPHVSAEVPHPDDLPGSRADSPIGEQDELPVQEMTDLTEAASLP